MTPAIEAAASKWFALRDAGLSAEQQRSLRCWLAEDERHSAAFAQLESAWSTFGKPARAGATDQLLAELAVRRARRRQRRAIVAAAALALFTTGVGVVRWHGVDSTDSPRSVAVLLNPQQEKLSDGSTVTLREGASITVNFTDSERQIVLRGGEALFEVQKDNSRPFTVVANAVEVRAVGTAFAVQSAGGFVDVLVTEGVVTVDTGLHNASRAIIRTEGDATAESVPTNGLTVLAGHRIVISDMSSSQPIRREAVPPAEIARRLSWRSPRVEFSAMPLVDAVSLLNREAVGRTNIRLKINEPTLNKMRVSGIFRTDNMDAFVMILEAGFGIKVDRTGDVFLLSKAQ